MVWLKTIKIEASTLQKLSKLFRKCISRGLQRWLQNNFRQLQLNMLICHLIRSIKKAPFLQNSGWANKQKHAGINQLSKKNNIILF